MSFDAEVAASLNDVVRIYDLKNDEGFLFCLFEAISNALYSSVGNADIKIKIDFTRQYKANEINKDKDSYIKSFAITDNGVGFADKNFDCFTRKIYKTTHDSGKGAGRIAFLKVFGDVSVDSYFKENSKVFHRSFIFSTSEIKDNRGQCEGNYNIGSTILFNNIKEKYQKHTKMA